MEDFDFQLKNSKQIKSETVAIIHQNKNIFQWTRRRREVSFSTSRGSAFSDPDYHKNEEYKMRLRHRIE